MDDPPPNLDVAEGGGEAHHLAALAPPPPPPLLLLLITSQACGQTFPSTTDARLASHLVLDPSKDANQFLRRLAPEKVVSLRWLENGFMRPAPPPEDEFKLDGGKERAEETQEVEGMREVAQEEEEEQEQEQDEDEDGDAESSSVLHPLSDYVNPEYASRGGWLKSEEEELARFLASNPQLDQNGHSVWTQYHLTHPSRSSSAYLEYYKRRRAAYFDSKIAELGGASIAQPAVHEQADDKEVDVEIERFAEPRTASKVSSRDRSPSFEDSEEDRSDASSDSNLEGSDPSSGPHHHSSSSPQSTPVANSSSTQSWNQNDRKDLLLLLVARKPGSMFIEVAHEFKKKHPRYTIRSIEAHYRRCKHAYDQAVQTARAQGPNASLDDSVVPVSGRIAPGGRWTKEEDADFVGMLARRKGPKSDVFDALWEKYPRRPSSAAAAHYQDHKKRIDAEVAAIQRKEGRMSTKGGPAADSESEELDEDDLMGDDEDSDDEEMDLRTPTSVYSSSSFLVDRKRPEKSQQGSSSKRTRIDSAFNTVASLSKTSSSSNHRHQHQSYDLSSSHNYASGSNHPLNQPYPPLPSFTRRVASGSTSSAHPQPHSDGALHEQPLPPSPPPPAPEIESSSDEEEDLEPESFLAFGAKPTSCPPGAPCC